MENTADELQGLERRIEMLETLLNVIPDLSDAFLFLIILEGLLMEFHSLCVI